MEVLNTEDSVCWSESLRATDHLMLERYLREVSSQHTLALFLSFLKHLLLSCWKPASGQTDHWSGMIILIFFSKHDNLQTFTGSKQYFLLLTIKNTLYWRAFLDQDKINMSTLALQWHLSTLFGLTGALSNILHCVFSFSDIIN